VIERVNPLDRQTTDIVMVKVMRILVVKENQIKKTTHPLKIQVQGRKIEKI